jgi:ATP-dependent DNA ligase
MLSEIIKPVFAIRYSEHFEGDGSVFFAAAVQHGLEGIVSRRRAVTAAGRQGRAMMRGAS